MDLGDLGIPELNEDKVSEEVEGVLDAAVEEDDILQNMAAQLEEMRKQNEELAKKLAARPVVAVEEEEVVELDPEDDRENWPTIRINEEDGKPNYAQINTGGTKKNGATFTHRMQIKRGEDVKVPPSVVDALRCAVQDRIKHTKHPVTGKTVVQVQKQPTESWYLVNGGKYVK